MNTQMERPTAHQEDQLALHSGKLHDDNNEHHSDKKSVLKKVKAKAKKIKDTIKGHVGHGHQHNHDHDHDGHHDDHETEAIGANTEDHGAPGMRQHGVPGHHRTAMKEDPLAAHSSGTRRTAIDKVCDVPTSRNRGYQPFNPSLPASNYVDNAATNRADFETGRQHDLGGMLEGDTVLEKDPHAPKDVAEARDAENYRTKVTDPTGMGLEQKAEQNPHTGAEYGEGKSYGEAVSSLTTNIADKAAKAKDAVASTLGYGVTHEEQLEKSGESEPPRPAAGSSMGVYGRKVATKVQETLAPVYEKLKPGNEEKALSDVITDALPLHKGNDQEMSKGEGVKGRVTESEEVKKQLGAFDETSEEDAGGTGVAKDMVHWMKETAISWFGKGDEVTQPSLQGSSEPSKGNENSDSNFNRGQIRQQK